MNQYNHDSDKPNMIVTNTNPSKESVTSDIQTTSKTIKRISRVLKHRRDSKSIESDNKYYLAVLRGDINLIKNALDNDINLINKTFNFNDMKLITKDEFENEHYVPPPLLPRLVRQAINNQELIYVNTTSTKLNNNLLEKLPLDQRWLITFGFSESTLLHYACISNQLEIVKLLINNGSNRNIKNSASQTPIQYTTLDGIKTFLNTSYSQSDSKDCIQINLNNNNNNNSCNDNSNNNNMIPIMQSQRRHSILNDPNWMTKVKLSTTTKTNNNNNNQPVNMNKTGNLLLVKNNHPIINEPINISNIQNRIPNVRRASIVNNNNTTTTNTNINNNTNNNLKSTKKVDKKVIEKYVDIDNHSVTTIDTNISSKSNSRLNAKQRNRVALSRKIKQQGVAVFSLPNDVLKRYRKSSVDDITNINNHINTTMIDDLEEEKEQYEHSTTKKISNDKYNDNKTNERKQTIIVTNDSNMKLINNNIESFPKISHNNTNHNSNNNHTKVIQPTTTISSSPPIALNLSIPKPIVMRRLSVSQNSSEMISTLYINNEHGGETIQAIDNIVVDIKDAKDMNRKQNINTNSNLIIISNNKSLINNNKNNRNNNRDILSLESGLIKDLQNIDAGVNQHLELYQMKTNTNIPFDINTVINSNNSNSTNNNYSINNNYCINNTNIPFNNINRTFDAYSSMERKTIPSNNIHNNNTNSNNNIVIPIDEMDLLAKAVIEIDKKERRQSVVEEQRRKSMVRMFEHIAPLENIANKIMNDESTRDISKLLLFNNSTTTHHYQHQQYNMNQEDIQSKRQMYHYYYYSNDNEEVDELSQVIKELKIETDVIDDMKDNPLSTCTYKPISELTFKELIWQRAGIYLNAYLNDRDQDKYLRSRKEAYKLGLYILKRDFKSSNTTLNNIDRWEALDYIMKRRLVLNQITKVKDN